MAEKVLSGVVNGDVIVPAAGSTTKFVADPLLFEAGGIKVTARVAVGIGIGVVLMALLKG